MNIKAYRIVNEAYLDDAMTGKGACLNGGRWNFQGTPLVYAASTLSLATLELIANIYDKNLIKDLYSIEIQFDSKLLKYFNQQSLPLNWKKYPAPKELKDIGAKWVNKSSSAVLAVPSAILDSELNYLFNVSHPDFLKISYKEPSPYEINPRIVTAKLMDKTR